VEAAGSNPATPTPEKLKASSNIFEEAFLVLAL
jgi:hypothetical protein